MRAVKSAHLTVLCALALVAVSVAACGSDPDVPTSPAAGGAGAESGAGGLAAGGKNDAGGQAGASGAQAAGQAGAASAGAGGGSGSGGGSPAGAGGGAGVGGESTAGSGGAEQGGAAGAAAGAAGAGGQASAGAAGVGGQANGGSGGAVAGPCVKTICMGGAVQSDPYEGGNEYLAALCEKLEGLIPSCDEKTGDCLPMFGWLGGKAPAKAALYKALDSSGDGFVDDSDEVCAIRIVGYSWGGLNARDIAEAWADDSNVPDNRKNIAILAAIDPFRVGDLEYLVPKNVEVFREYRHSIAPDDDCSSGAPLGPYKGLPPRCAPTSDCQDYDYSLAPDELFPTLSGAPQNVLGKSVEHCNAADVAAVPVLALLAGEPAPKLPPSTPVKPLK